MATVSHAAQGKLRLPPLEAGEHFDQPPFHARYKAMPPALRAALIGGVVLVPSPLARGHGCHHALVMAWLGHDWRATPGTKAGENMTTMLGETSAPQPDGALSIDPVSGGQTGLSEDEYRTGPPEWSVEVASRRAAMDRHAQRRDDEPAGVVAYGVVVWRQGVIRWCVFQDGTSQARSADAPGSCRSRVLPGLWLHATALQQRGGVTVRDVRRQGWATPEPAAFVPQLQGR